MPPFVSSAKATTTVFLYTSSSGFAALCGLCTAGTVPALTLGLEIYAFWRLVARFWREYAKKSLILLSTLLLYIFFAFVLWFILVQRTFMVRFVSCGLSLCLFRVPSRYTNKHCKKAILCGLSP